MATKNDVLIVILNYKGWQDTLDCVDAVMKQTYRAFDIFLVENGSHDGSNEKLSNLKKNEKIIYIQNDVNRGFSGGVNQGIRYAIEHDYHFTVLLNNDAVVSPAWLSTLRKTIDTVDASAVTGLLLDGAGKKIESTGDSYTMWGLPFPRQRDENVDRAVGSGYVFGGTAGASLYKTELFDKIGLFDEKFFAYFEDTDINFRAQLAGYTAYYEDRAIAYHDHGSTSKKIPGFTVKQTFKNLPLFFWKDVPAQLIIPIGVRFLIVYTLIYLRAIARGQFVVATQGMIGSIRNFPYALRQRRTIQRSRTVTIDYLRSIIYPGLPPSNRATLRRFLHL
jgi:GT2 family glycosyltransferase